MTNDKIQPCLRRIDADCFRSRPAWAKRAFAYRLVHLLTPKPLTKRLPKGLRTALIPPGVVWQPGDPLPPGAIMPAVLPPGVEATGPTPPTYTEVWSPGPPSPVGGRTFAPGEPWFYDDFNNLTDYNWEDQSSHGEVTIVNNKAKMVSDAGSTSWFTQLHRLEANTWPTNFDLSFELRMEEAGGRMFFLFYTGVHYVGLRFTLNTLVEIMTTGGWEGYTVDSFLDTTVIWELKVRGVAQELFRNGASVFTPADVPLNATANQMYIGRLSYNGGTVSYVDDLKVFPR